VFTFIVVVLFVVEEDVVDSFVLFGSCSNERAVEVGETERVVAIEELFEVLRREEFNFSSLYKSSETGRVGLDSGIAENKDSNKKTTFERIKTEVLFFELEEG
jgi:hypothetical protein